MKKIIAGMMVFFFLAAPVIVQAVETHDWGTLNKLSDTAYQLAKQNKFTESAEILKYFEQEIQKMPELGESMPKEHFRTISISQQHALEAMSSGGAREDEKVRAVTQFRLLVDALGSQYDPLWSSFEEPVMTVLQDLKRCAERGDTLSFQYSWSKFAGIYNMIYPSVVVDVHPQEIKRMDAHISVVEDSLFFSLPATARTKQLLVMEEDLKTIFERAHKDEADPSLLWVIISTGSIIISTLTYVGWRKYRAETERRNQRDTDQQK
ncbi:sporulation protein YpjB [Bacillus lacus]|uniref:Sporulation protein YpjB n=1 Tax=Metabacillus lacus TaxID=1983721 RepID=A0A7X2IWI5_9BACI|nr:sporulation protein YpjB [Metabacillus lacus]MRX70979.1 sporulation protein YpjB [Metabacillus lacus]